MGTRDIPAQDVASQPFSAGQMPPSEQIVDAYAMAAPATRRRLIAELVGQLYEHSPATVRSRLLEKLLRPMSVFTLISIANGQFAQIKMRNAEWQGFQLRTEDIRGISANDVIALVDRVQQVGDDAIQSLAVVIRETPSLAETAAAKTLLMLAATRSPIGAAH